MHLVPLKSIIQYTREPSLLKAYKEKQSNSA